MDDLLREFLTESADNMLKVEQEMVELEQRPDDADLLGSIFRSMHTVKGTCGFLGLVRLEAVAHAAESVLGALRDGELDVSDAVVSDVLAAADVIKEILEGLEAEHEEPAGDDGAIIERLNGWLDDDGTHTDESLDLLFRSAREGHLGSSSASASPPDAVAEPPEIVTPGWTGPDRRAVPRDGGGRSGRALADTTLRVDVDVLDALMNLAGELVLTRNQLIQLTQRDEDSTYATPVQQLNRVTTDLQQAVMRTRMQPIGNAWGKLPRLVRDLSSAGGKRLALTMLGAETELDRQILQAIKDPLTHMIRNSADHGIESPAERVAAGKPPEGQIVLEAFHQGGHIVIEIRDDGKGLDAGAIRRKAVERGLVAAEDAAALSEHRVFEYVFEPGFSTAGQVTPVSGRGVGMDVVRRNIEQIGGTIELHSVLGRGTTVRIKIPLTLAIMSALIVGVGEQSFAVPQIGVLELVRVSARNGHLVENVNGALFYRLRDQLLPLVRLERVLGMDDDAEIPVRSILVCQVGASRFGLCVDSILDTHEIVVKPVGRMVKGVRVYAGTTILGDGRVIMILDLAGIAQTTDVLARGDEHAAEAAAPSQRQEHERGTSVLLFDAGVPAPRAVYLSQVSRLEEFAARDIEWADGRWVVQYRGELLPLVPASDGIDMAARDPRPVVVFSDGVRSMGLAVDGVRDILESPVKIERESTTPGLIGSTVIAGRTTELVDIDYHLAQVQEVGPATPSEARPGSGDPAAARGRRILLVDDSPFFLNLLSPVLRAEGYDVTVSHDGLQALSRLEGGEAFDAVVSDIDMPTMDGVELARGVRRAGFQDLPLVALTSRSSDDDRDRGLAAGFDRYLRKFDQDEVVEAVRAVLEEVSA
ncbi:MAG: hybrid sensor histidine kinase/response regulator [Longimicrobiales bacterium]